MADYPQLSVEGASTRGLHGPAREPACASLFDNVPCAGGSLVSAKAPHTAHDAVVMASSALVWWQRVAGA